MRRFEGKVAVVTGAGQGSGRAIARRLAAEGAAVAVVDREADRASAVAKEIQEAGGRGEALVADVTKAADVARMAQSAERQLGPVDILVNNAGVLRSTPLTDITPEEWSQVLDANLTGAFLCARALLPGMRARRRGSVVNMSSMAGRATSTLGGAHYTAAKAGLLGLSRHMAREMAPHGVNVNAVCPGIVDTPMVRGALDAAALTRLRESIPMKRLADPDEIAALVAFLSSDEARYITGAAVDIHGGEMIIQ